jgi:hypothetical protein
MKTRSFNKMIVIACATLLASLGSASAANPSVMPTRHLLIKYSLASGANSKAFTVPAYLPVALLGTCVTSGARSVGQVSLQRVPNTFLVWVGLESTAGATITQGFSSIVGTHIVYLDSVHTLDIQVNDANSFRIHNGNAFPMAGLVTLSY